MSFLRAEIFQERIQDKIRLICLISIYINFCLQSVKTTKPRGPEYPGNMPASVRARAGTKECPKLSRLFFKINSRMSTADGLSEQEFSSMACGLARVVLP